MAKKIFKIPKHQTGRSITTKTPYGTTSDMVITDEKILSQVTVKDGFVLCKDDQGYYITDKNVIDSGLVDQLRCSESFRDILNLNIDDVTNEK